MSTTFVSLICEPGRVEYAVELSGQPDFLPICRQFCRRRQMVNHVTGVVLRRLLKPQLCFAVAVGLDVHRRKDSLLYNFSNRHLQEVGQQAYCRGREILGVDELADNFCSCLGSQLCFFCLLVML